MNYCVIPVGAIPLWLPRLVWGGRARGNHGGIAPTKLLRRAIISCFDLALLIDKSTSANA